MTAVTQTQRRLVITLTALPMSSVPSAICPTWCDVDHLAEVRDLTIQATALSHFMDEDADAMGLAGSGSVRQLFTRPIDDGAVFHRASIGEQVMHGQRSVRVDVYAADCGPAVILVCDEECSSQQARDLAALLIEAAETIDGRNRRGEG